MKVGLKINVKKLQIGNEKEAQEKIHLRESLKGTFSDLKQHGSYCTEPSENDALGLQVEENWRKLSKLPTEN